MEKKYELLPDDTYMIDIIGNHILYRIRALRDFDRIKKGDLGGYIKSEDNLSHEGNCWVGYTSMVYGSAKVFNNAKILGGAKVYCNATVYGDSVVYGEIRIFDNASVHGKSEICDNILIYDQALIYNANIHGNAIINGDATIDGAEISMNAHISGKAFVHENAKVCGNAYIDGFSDIHGNALINGNAHISSDADISSEFDYFIIKGAGSKARFTTFFKCKDGVIKVNCGCFNGTLKQFKKKVKETHGHSKYAKEYLHCIKMAKIHFEMKWYMRRLK